MGVGVTHHISRSSVCIRARDVPSLGARVQVIVDMPPTSANTRPGRLMGEGVAVRLVRAFGQPTAFAAKVRFRSKWAYPPAPVECSTMEGRRKKFDDPARRAAYWASGPRTPEARFLCH